MNYIISAPGRTGGHLLAGIIMESGANSVHYTHDPLLDLGDDLNTTLLIVDRRDRFSALMSNAIVHRTGQSNEYNNKTIEPFVFEPGMFRQAYVLYHDYYNKHNLSRMYAAVHKVYFEDFMNNPDSIRTLLKLPAPMSNQKSTALGTAWQLMHNPAPYCYQDVVLNWEKLKLLYVRMSENHE